MKQHVTTDHDKNVLNAVSYALDGKIGQHDDIARLRHEIESGSNRDKLHVACEIAVAFIRWSRDLKTAIADETFDPFDD